MKPTLPLAECTGEEIITRTVYQIVLLDYRDNAEQYDRAATRLLDLALCWRGAGLHLIADVLVDAAHHVAGGGTIASWRTLHSALHIGSTTRVAYLRRRGRR